MLPDGIDEFIDKALQTDSIPMEVDEALIVRGPPLTDAELFVARNNISVWQSPAAFTSATETLCKCFKSADWFSRPQLKFLHDAYVLAEFVRLTKVESVCLAKQSEQWPDGYVKLGNKIHNIEATSHHGGRKLGDEYGKDANHAPKFVDSALTRAELIPRSLDEALNAKNKKNYGSKCWLVVYLNISGFALDQREIAKVIGATKDRHAQQFDAISVRWNGTCF